MRKSLKTIPALLLAGIFLCVSCLPAQAQPLESAPPIQLTAPSYLLADAETGAIIFEKNADTPRPGGLADQADDRAAGAGTAGQGRNIAG